MKFQRFSAVGERPTRYKVLVREAKDDPFRLLCWVMNSGDGWFVPGAVMGLGNKTFPTRQAAAEAVISQRGLP
jgi:hypothetical protein